MLSAAWYFSGSWLGAAIKGTTIGLKCSTQGDTFSICICNRYMKLQISRRTERVVQSRSNRCKLLQHVHSKGVQCFRACIDCCRYQVADKHLNQIAIQPRTIVRAMPNCLLEFSSRRPGHTVSIIPHNAQSLEAKRLLLSCDLIHRSFQLLLPIGH